MPKSFIFMRSFDQLRDICQRQLKIIQKTDLPTLGRKQLYEREDKTRQQSSFWKRWLTWGVIIQTEGIDWGDPLLKTPSVTSVELPVNSNVLQKHPPTLPKLKECSRGQKIEWNHFQLQNGNNLLDNIIFTGSERMNKEKVSNYFSITLE